MKKKNTTEFLKQYRFGADLFGILLTAILVLPNIVSVIMAAAIENYYAPFAHNAANVAALVFLVIAVLLLTAVRRREEKPFSFFSLLGTLTWLFALLYYIAWIFQFCDYGNVAVRAFLTVCPCITLISYEADRRNYPAIVPTALFALCHIIALIILYT